MKKIIFTIVAVVLLSVMIFAIVAPMQRKLNTQSQSQPEPQSQSEPSPQPEPKPQPESNPQPEPSSKPSESFQSANITTADVAVIFNFVENDDDWTESNEDYGPDGCPDDKPYNTGIHDNNGQMHIICLKERPGAYKPVIYLYNYDEKVNVKVNFDNNTKFTTTYPEYPEDGWTIYANPDGHLNYNGKTYRYLYWEAETTDQFDFSKGFCIEGSSTAEFLEATLQKLGLNDDEINEFIIYWLPLMQNNKYNVISFQTDAYENMAFLEVTPAPDTMLRVYMAWYPSETKIPIKAQELSHTERIGKTVIEWGGTQIGGVLK